VLENEASGNPPSLANDYICLLAIAISLISADMKQRIVSIVSSTVAVSLPVELMKTMIKGV
jgi:hypothetical protein